jgi:glycosyltransferase involved in cell wall biosynthesis
MSTLRVLHVNTSDLEGGAARAANRIHRALRSIGVDSHMLVANRREASTSVLRPLGPMQRGLHLAKAAAGSRIAAFQRTPTNPVLHSINYFSSGFADWINNSDFDIVNLHWLGGEMLSVEEIARIRKPLCWTMHDMWAFSGAEHYDDLDYPGRYLEGYTAATRPSGYSGPDIDAWVWRRKKKAWAGKQFHLVSPSRWLADCAKQSALMGRQNCEVIPNCVDTDTFKPVDRQVAKIIMNLDSHKRYILFGAMSSTSDRRKGFHLLQPALKRLSLQGGIAGNVELLVFGAQTPVSVPDLGLPAHYLGTFHDDVSLALLYNAADVFVAPSLQDNLPNTLVESLACGTPCVTFALGGMLDLVEPGVTGMLAEPGDSDSLANCLFEILGKPPDRAGIRHEAMRAHAGKLVATRYYELYRNMLAKLQ